MPEIHELSDEELLNAPSAEDIVKKFKPEEEEVDTPSDEQEGVSEPSTEGEEGEHITEGNEASYDAYNESQDPTPVDNEEQNTDNTNDSGTDYKAFYDAVINTPFKANGKILQIRDSNEAIKLMQMGANYTRKMQELADVRRIKVMLERHGLLDEDKVGFLIDLYNRNPAAISKYFVDNKMDPLDVDTSSEPTYSPGSHRVTEDELRFRDTVNDVVSREQGSETVQFILNHWDQASQDMLYKAPDVLEVIREHRTNGIYEKVDEEIQRQKAFGNISPSTPYVQAYTQVFERMVQSKSPALPRSVGQGTYQGQDPNRRVRAAGTNRSGSSRSPQGYVNPLEMSDEEFIKFARV